MGVAVVVGLLANAWSGLTQRMEGNDVGMIGLAEGEKRERGGKFGMGKRRRVGRWRERMQRALFRPWWSVVGRWDGGVGREVKQHSMG